MGIYGINSSWTANREKPEKGRKVGRMLNILGEVRGVPTIKLINNGNIIKYNEHITAEGLIEFVQSNLWEDFIHSKLYLRFYSINTDYHI